MTDIAVRVENLSKRYRIGQIVGYSTLRESLMNLAYAPVRRLRKTADRSKEKRQKTEDGRQITDVSGPPSLVSSPPSPVSSPSNYIWALKDVSFEVQRGEAVGIIGRNGSGKTTILKILSRITAPTEGYAEVHGRVGSLLEVGTGFHPELTGRENIYLNGAVLGMKKAEVKQKFDEIVAFSEIEKFLDTPVKRYSSGMYVRLAFSVAAHLEPEILIVDEVLAVGDAAFQKKCLGKMSNVASEGRTVLFVSHNMAAVQELCQRAILLREGQIVEDNSARKVVSDYLSAQSDSSSGDMDVSDPSLRRNSLPDSRFRWTRVGVIDFAGRKTGFLRFGEPFEIILQGFAEAELSDVLAGFSIDSVLGIAVFNSFQIDNGIAGQLPAGKVLFRVRMEPNLLAPGLYTISLAARGDGVIDFLPTTLQFTVSTAGEDDKNPWRNYHGGMIRYPCKWYRE
jgi:lipopolysaccharide transport system ATP-binding protein